MNTRASKRTITSLLVAAGVFLSGSAMAASNDRGNNRDHDSEQKADHVGIGKGAYFEQHQRDQVHQHFAKEKHQGKCLPGLAKKNNDCNPPGQVKQWQLGQKLASEVISYQLPPELAFQLGQAPTGYRYAQVDNDVLLLELGSMIVIDMIQGLE